LLYHRPMLKCAKIVQNFRLKIASLELANPILLAPMAGISNLPYRRIMKEFGAALVFSEMVSANGRIRDGRRTLELVRTCPEESPRGVQLFGSEPEILAACVAHLAGTGDLIDLNLGCPVNKVVRSGAGSALLRDPKRVADVITALRQATEKPLTVKIRSGWDHQSVNFLEIGRIAEECGADAITLHPRTRTAGFSGQADWAQIGLLKQEIDIPVIGSGDIFTADDAVRMIETTGCDGIMIGRGGYGNPWLIDNILRRLSGGEEKQPKPTVRLEVAERHINYMVETIGIKKTMFEMRKHLCWYSRGMPDAAGFRLAVNRCSSLDEVRNLTRDFFAPDEEQDADNCLSR